MAYYNGFWGITIDCQLLPDLMMLLRQKEDHGKSGTAIYFDVSSTSLS